MYKRILVPVDGSATSSLGLNEALRIAAETGARVRVLNVVDEMMFAAALDTYPVSGLDEMINSVRESGQEALDQARALAAKRKVNAACVQLDSRARAVSDVILTEAKTWPADLIVMGTHGRKGVNRLLLGSDAERVLHETIVPVLLVRGTEATQSKVSAKRKSKAAGKRRVAQPA